MANASAGREATALRHEVLLDALLEDTRPDHDASVKLIEVVQLRKVEGLVTPIILGTVTHYLQCAEKRLGTQVVMDLLTLLLDTFTMVPVTAEHFRSSIISSFMDKEDGVQFFAAAGHGKLFGVVSRDGDFQEHIHLPVKTAAGWLKEFSA